MHDLIVLGGGPAGLTAAMYAVQKRLDVLLLTRDMGGKTNYHLKLPFVERHMVINGDEIISRFSREIEYLDFVHLLENGEKVEKIRDGYAITTSNGKIYETRALIVATGAKGQLLNVPGEQEFMMRGLCYSALSYAQLFLDRDVVVIGDGELALRGTAELARIARHVILVASRQHDFESPLGRRLRTVPNVAFYEDYDVLEVKGDTFARSLIVKAPDGSTRELHADAFFVEKDLLPRSQIVAHLVDLDEKNHVKVNSRNETTAEGIYAAGDVTNTFSEQVLISIGEGAKAALSAYEYLLRSEPTKELA